MLTNIKSPEYTEFEAIELWKVRVLARDVETPLDVDGETLRDVAIGFFLGLNFSLERTYRLADEVTR